MATSRSVQNPRVVGAYREAADGTRNLAGDVATDTRFPIGSVTKTLTALLAARLSVDGVVSWSVPVAFDGDRPTWTLRQLLTHTASIPFELRADQWTGASLTTSELDEVVDSTTATVSRMPLPPGTWHYSNLGYAIAARFLENATGEPFAELLAKHLLEPMGMQQTSFPDPSTEGPCVLGAAAPAGDLLSTLDDLMVLARALEGSARETVTREMIGLLFDGAVRTDRGYLGAGVRVYGERYSRVLVSSGTIRDRTTCVVAWPGRGSSVLLAERGYDHSALRDIGLAHWGTPSTRVRSWWWDGQEVLEVRGGGAVELVLRETLWPYPFFTGRTEGSYLVGTDWRGEPLCLADCDGALIGPGVVLTKHPSDSAYASVVLP